MKPTLSFPILCFVLTSFIWSACESENPAPETPTITSYKYNYLHYPASIAPSSTGLVELEYRNGRIVKRTGGLLQLSSASGYAYAFSDQVYEDIEYSGNTATIVTKSSSPDFVYAQNEKVVLFDEKKRMLQKNVLKTNGRRDTVDYFYNERGLVSRAVINKNYYFTGTADYFYNNDNNLDSVITVYTNTGAVYSRIVETFYDYDSAPNPFRGMVIFDETYYRALSENNYLSYSIRYYDSNGTITSTGQRNWKFEYDEKGYPIFNK